MSHLTSSKVVYAQPRLNYHSVGLIGTLLVRMRTTLRFSFGAKARRLFYSAGTVGFTLALIPALSFLVLRWPEFGNWDGHSYALAGWLFLKGNPFYQIAWMDKPPLGLLLYAPGYLLGGRHGLQLYFALILCVEATLACIWLDRLGFGAFARLSGTAALILATFTLPELDSLSLSHLTNLFFLSALISVSSDTGRGFFVAGFFVGFSFFIRQNNVIFCIVPLFFAKNVKTKELIKYVWGGISAFVVGCILSVFASDPSVFVYTTFAYPFAYLRLNIPGSMDSTVDIVGFLLRTPFTPSALSALAIIFLFRRKLPVTIHAIGVLGAATIAIVVAPNKLYLHYFGYSLILCALLAACVGQAVEESISSGSGSRKTVVTFLIVLTAWIAAVGAQVSRRYSTANQISEESAEQLYGQSLQILLSAVRNKHSPVKALIVGANNTKELWSTFTPALLMRETGVLPAQPLYFLPYLGPRFEPALPTPFREPWTKMNSYPPDIVIMFPESLHTNRDIFGTDLAEKVHALVAGRGYEVLRDTPLIFAASRVPMQ